MLKQFNSNVNYFSEFFNKKSADSSALRYLLLFMLAAGPVFLLEEAHNTEKNADSAQKALRSLDKTVVHRNNASHNQVHRNRKDTHY